MLLQCSQSTRFLPIFVSLHFSVSSVHCLSFGECDAMTSLCARFLHGNSLVFLQSAQNSKPFRRSSAFWMRLQSQRIVSRLWWRRWRWQRKRYCRFNYLLSISWIRFRHFTVKSFMHSACGRSVFETVPSDSFWLVLRLNGHPHSLRAHREKSACQRRRRATTHRWWVQCFGSIAVASGARAPARQKQCSVINFDLLAIREEI